MISSFSHHLVTELTNEARELGSGLMSRINKRFISKVSKKPVFLLRDAWTVCAEESTSGGGQVVYQNSNGNFSQTLKLNRQNDSLTVVTRKQSRDLSLEQEMVFSLSEGEIQKNRLVRHTNGSKAIYNVFETDTKRKNYRLHAIRKKKSKAS